MIQDKDYRRWAMMLPFYVNGTLASRECALIDNALRHSPLLRAELAEQGRLASGVKAGGLRLVKRG